MGHIEQAVVHYGSSTGFFGNKMFAGGPGYLSAAVLYENMVIESYGRNDLPFPVVAVYPKEGTFWSDHPVGVVERPWVTPEHRDAAEKYVEFLLDGPQQRRALEFGFRPGDVAIPLAAPLDTAHGVDPKQPQTTLEVPSATVIKAAVDLWRKRKKHANVVLPIDISGSMRGKKINNAKAGGRAVDPHPGRRRPPGVVVLQSPGQLDRPRPGDENRPAASPDQSTRTSPAARRPSTMPSTRLITSWNAGVPTTRSRPSSCSPTGKTTKAA